MKKFLILLSMLFCFTVYAQTETLNWYIDGNVYTTTTCESGNDILLPTTPTKRGYTFKGWLGYTPIEYLKSTGTQWINTGVVFSGPNAEVVLKFTPIKVNYSGRYSYTGAGWTFTANVVSPGKLGFYHGSINGATRTDLQASISENTTYILDMVQEYNNFTYSINGTINSAYTTITYPNYPYILFGTSYNSNSLGNERSEMKLYYAKIYDNGVLVRDFAPALDLDGVPCMFDKVEHKFYYNQGTGQFIAGPIIGAE